jgi:molybdopterin-guanine dinucleotide biosynthesis protein A
VIAGLALAGGRSSRFGSEKAVVEIGGRTMLARALDALRPGCDALAVSARPGSGAAAIAEGLGLPVLADDPGHPEGPLAGIHAGLAWARGRGAERLLVAPCDTPYLPADYAARLLAPGGAAVAVAVAGGEDQPLCSVWQVGLASEVAAAMQDGEHPSVGRLLRRLGATVVVFEDAATFRNLNRIEDLE